MGQDKDVTRVIRPRKGADGGQSTPPERLALFVRARSAASAARLLDGLAGPWATAARDMLRACEAMSSAERHGRLALEFGDRPGEVGRLRALVSEASPGLRCAIALQLSPHHRALFPSLVARARAAGPGAPALTRLATRLVREALR